MEYTQTEIGLGSVLKTPIVGITTQ